MNRLGKESAEEGEAGLYEFYQLRIRTLWQYFWAERLPFILICIYMFLEYVRPQSIYPAVDILPYAQITVILTWIAYLLNENKEWAPNIENKLLVALFVVVLLSSVFAYSPSAAYEELSTFIAWVLIYFLIVNIVNTEKRFFVFLLLFLVWNLKMSQHGFRSWASIGFGYRSWGVTGAPGWFHNSGEFGIEMCIFLPLSLYFIFALKKHWSRKKLFIISLLPVTAAGSIIATTSRGAILGAAAVAVAVLLKSKVRISVVASVVLVGLVAYMVMPPDFKARFETAGEDETSVSRLTRWGNAIDIMKNHPVLGVGYKNWMPYYSTYYPPDEPNFGGWGLPHNIFLDAGAELGYAGLIIFVLMIIFSFINNRRTRSLARKANNNFLCYMAHGFDVALVGLLVSASFVSVLYYPFFWINTAFIVALNNVAKKAMRRQNVVCDQHTPPRKRFDSQQYHAHS